MEHTIKLPKKIDYKKVNILASPDASIWETMTNKDYRYLCRARDDDKDNSFTFWKVGLFVGGSVELGSVQYSIYPINNTCDKYVYEDDYAVRYDEAQRVNIPCICFDDCIEPVKGEVVGFYKDGSCAVLLCGAVCPIKIDSSKVRYVSDILEME